MSSRTYFEAQEKALEAIESDHEGLFLCTTRVDENGRTDLEVISGIDSGAIEERHGQIRLEQAAFHIQHLSDLFGLSPIKVAGEIASVIENGEIDIEVEVDERK